MHPTRWRQVGSERVRLELRCGECRARTTGEYDLAQVARYDCELVEARLELTALYQAVVRSNMQAEGERLRAAFALDLIGADDFGGYNRRVLR
jgi:hypothetical protein